MMILLSSVSSSSDVKQKRFVMPVVYEDNRAVPSTLINAPNVSNVANGFSKRPPTPACVFLGDRWWTGFVCNWRWH